jgi:hypothetical protein
LLLLLFALGACNGPGANNAPPAPDVTAEVRAFRDAALALQLREDGGAQHVDVQFIQIGVNLESPFRGTLSSAEAERLASSLLKQARDGAEFDKLVYQHSWETPQLGNRPGSYRVVRDKSESRTGVRPETMFDAALRKAFWRLKPGEISAVEYHRRDNESGYYVVRRLTEEETRADNPANFDPSNEAVAAMRKHAAEVLARDELNASTVKVQHILVGRYAPGPRDELKPLKPVEAEEHAAELYARAIAGEDFDALVKKYTYDAHPGIYTMSREEGAKDMTYREDMVAAFWKVAWRLNPGEIGVTLYDRYDSPFGYHIIKRIE